MQAAIQCRDIQPGIAREQCVAIEFVGVLKGVARWRIAVETAAGVGIIGAQIDTRPIVDGHAHIPGGAEIVIAVGLTIAVARVGRRHAVGGIAVDGAAIFDAVHCAVHRRVGVKGIERTAFGQRGAGNRRVPAAPGQHVDHTAHRVAAVKGGLRPAQDFDPVDIVGEKVAQKRLAIGAAGVVDANAVDQHQGLARRCAAHADGGVLAHPAIAHRGQARHLAQRIVDEADLLALQGIRRDDGNGFAGQGRGLGAAGGGHHHGFEIGSGCGGCRPRQKHQSGNKGTFAHGALLIMGSGARARVIANRARKNRRNWKTGESGKPSRPRTTTPTCRRGGHPAVPGTPRPETGRRHKTGLLASGSAALVRLPGKSQWHLNNRSPVTVAGAAAVLTAFPKSCAFDALVVRVGGGGQSGAGFLPPPYRVSAIPDI